MIQGKLVTAFFTVIMLAAAIPYTVQASQIEFTPSIKASLDKTLAVTAPAQAGQISSLYNELLTLETQDRNWDDQIKSLHAKNSDSLSALNKEIKQIDATLLDELEADATQTKERHQSLLSLYTALNKQIEAARLVKNKELSSMLRFQANTLKIPVQLARADIKAKENKWKAAKGDTAKTIKKIRGTLADIDPNNAQIKAKQSAIKTIEASLSPLWTAFKLAVKREDAVGAQGTLGSLITLFQQINEENQKTFNLEVKISDILSAAKAQIPHPLGSAN